MKNQFNAAMEAYATRYEFAESQWIAQAKREGWPIIARGQYCPTGIEIVQTQAPDGKTRDFDAKLWDESITSADIYPTLRQLRQLDAFAQSAEDLPLFSGTPVPVTESAYAPEPESNIEAMQLFSDLDED